MDGKKIALILGGIGLILSLFLFGLNTGEEGYDSTYLSIVLIFVLLVLFFTAGLFLYYSIIDLKKHPEDRKESKSMWMALGSTFILALIFSFIFGGMKPVISGSGVEFSNKFQLLGISTIIWMTIFLLLGATVLSLLPLFKKEKS